MFLILQATILVNVLVSAAEPPSRTDPCRDYHDDIAERHRNQSSVVMLIGKAGVGKSSFARTLTDARVTSDQHVMRMVNPNNKYNPGRREKKGVPLFEFSGTTASTVGAAERRSAMIKQAMTTTTAVVETSFLPLYCDEGEDAPLVVIDTPGINDAGVIETDGSTSAPETNADEFVADIIYNSLHVNNSYGGVNRFVLLMKESDLGRSDGNGHECIRQLAHSLGATNSQAPETDDAKRAAELHFMRNLSIVFTQMDADLNMSTRMRQVKQGAVLELAQAQFYKMFKVADDTGIQLVQGVELDHVADSEIPCYFVNNESVRVRQMTDCDLEHEISSHMSDEEKKLKGEEARRVRETIREELLEQHAVSKRGFDETCENIKALKRQLSVSQKIQLESALVHSTAMKWFKKFDELERKHRALQEEAEARAAQRAQEEEEAMEREAAHAAELARLNAEAERQAEMVREMERQGLDAERERQEAWDAEKAVHEEEKRRMQAQHEADVARQLKEKEIEIAKEHKAKADNAKWWRNFWRVVADGTAATGATVLGCFIPPAGASVGAAYAAFRTTCPPMQYEKWDNNNDNNNN